METKYISKNKENKLWKISITKTGKAIRYFKTQVEAIKFAKTFKNIEKIFVKKRSGWVEITVNSKEKKNLMKKTQQIEKTPSSETNIVKLEKEVKGNIAKAELIKKKNSLSQTQVITNNKK